MFLEFFSIISVLFNTYCHWNKISFYFKRIYDKSKKGMSTVIENKVSNVIIDKVITIQSEIFSFFKENTLEILALAALCRLIAEKFRGKKDYRIDSIVALALLPAILKGVDEPMKQWIKFKQMCVYGLAVITGMELVYQMFGFKIDEVKSQSDFLKKTIDDSLSKYHIYTATKQSGKALTAEEKEIEMIVKDSNISAFEYQETKEEADSDADDESYDQKYRNHLNKISSFNLGIKCKKEDCVARAIENGFCIDHLICQTYPSEGYTPMEKMGIPEITKRMENHDESMKKVKLERNRRRWLGLSILVICCTILLVVLLTRKKPEKRIEESKSEKKNEFIETKIKEIEPESLEIKESKSEKVFENVEKLEPLEIKKLDILNQKLDNNDSKSLELIYKGIPSNIIPEGKNRNKKHFDTWDYFKSRQWIEGVFEDDYNKKLAKDKAYREYITNEEQFDLDYKLGDDNFDEYSNSSKQKSSNKNAFDYFQKIMKINYAGSEMENYVEKLLNNYRFKEDVHDFDKTEFKALRGEFNAVDNYLKLNKSHNQVEEKKEIKLYTGPKIEMDNTHKPISFKPKLPIKKEIAPILKSLILHDSIYNQDLQERKLESIKWCKVKNCNEKCGKQHFKVKCTQVNCSENCGKFHPLKSNLKKFERNLYNRDITKESLLVSSDVFLTRTQQGVVKIITTLKGDEIEECCGTIVKGVLFTVNHIFQNNIDAVKIKFSDKTCILAPSDFNLSAKFDAAWVNINKMKWSAPPGITSLGMTLPVKGNQVNLYITDRHSNGYLEDFDSENITHFCSSQKGWCGGPIVDGKSNKVVGIHKAGTETKNNPNFAYNLMSLCKEYEVFPKNS